MGNKNKQKMERIGNLSQQLSGKQDFFSQLALAPADPILSTSIAFKNDKDANKINLGVGAYRTNEGKPYIFNAVSKAEAQILQHPDVYNHEYLPIDGFKPFVESSQKLAFGDACSALKEGRVCSAQALSGTGGLRVGFEFLRLHYPSPVYIPQQTWGNHLAIIKDAGLPIRTYPYFEAKTRGLDFDGMTKTLAGAPDGAIVLLHPCAHNPTGVDPTQEQWEQILKMCLEKSFLVFFDSAYQGFVSGDFVKDAWTIRRFMEAGCNFILTQSFAKNFGLYGERVGAIHIVCASKDAAARTMSQLKLVVRPMYSNPPCHGAFIIDRIVRSPELLAEFMGEMKNVANRITDMRKALYDELVVLKVPGNWTHIINQIGMFSYTGLTPQQCTVLINKHHIYLLKNGRISMAGINTKNVAYLAKAMADVVVNVK